MEAACQQIIELTAYNGAANIDFRRGYDGTLGAIVECNPRFWYSMPAAMVQGINFVQVGLEMVLPNNNLTARSTEFREGYYYPLRAALKNVWTKNVSPENLREIVREAMDILPHLYNFVSSLHSFIHRS
jgi:predicted ATP-grasp superfamily ATP-dependent carboligase